ncbi:hypothetical protein IJ750_01595 [bacterium]|nr:hypothetical protein [bacterium]
MNNVIFLRKMLEKLLNNEVIGTIISFVNFCNEYRYYQRKGLKFLKKMPLNKVDVNEHQFGQIVVKADK